MAPPEVGIRLGFRDSRSTLFKRLVCVETVNIMRRRTWLHNSREIDKNSDDGGGGRQESAVCTGYETAAAQQGVGKRRYVNVALQRSSPMHTRRHRTINAHTSRRSRPACPLKIHNSCYSYKDRREKYNHRECMLPFPSLRLCRDC